MKEAKVDWLRESANESYGEVEARERVVGHELKSKRVRGTEDELNRARDRESEVNK